MCVKIFFWQILFTSNYYLISSQGEICSKNTLFEYSQESCSKQNAIFDFEIKQRSKMKERHLNGFEKFQLDVSLYHHLQKYDRILQSKSVPRALSCL